MKKNIEINNNMLTKDEILYLSELLKNRNDWKYQTYFDQPRQYFDSLYVDVNKLKKYYELICENGKYEIIDLLIKSGCEPNVKSRNGFTPLHIAARFNHTTVAHILLINNVNINDIISEINNLYNLKK